MKNVTTVNSNIVDELESIMADEIQKEIDFEVLHKLLGWTVVQLPYFESRYHSIDIANWATENCSGKFHRNGTSYMFENQKDAIMFTLKWR